MPDIGNPAVISALSNLLAIRYSFAMARSVTPHLMFEGAAEDAMNFYLSVFPGSSITQIARYPEGSGPAAGKVIFAVFQIAGQSINCTDSPVRHEFTFTPASSLFVECETPDELERVFAALSHGGETLMPLDNYGFSTRFGWCNDRFGVSWQLNLR